MSSSATQSTVSVTGVEDLPESAGGFGFRHCDAGHSAYDVADETGDCGVRAVSIATGRDYGEVREGFIALLTSRRGRTAENPESVKTGLKRTTVGTFLGHEWAYHSHHGRSPLPRFVSSEVPTDQTVIVVLGKHFCPVINGVIHDLFDPSGPRAVVYGYFHRVSSR